MSEPRSLDPKDEHWYQIGSTPVYLRIKYEGGKPRLSYLMTALPDGTPCEPTPVHLATFVGGIQAQSVVDFLDAMMKQVNNAIEHYEKLHNDHHNHPSPE